MPKNYFSLCTILGDTQDCQLSAGPRAKKCSTANASLSVSICVFGAIWFAGPCDVGGVSGEERCSLREKGHVVPKGKLKFHYLKRENGC